MHKPRWKLQWIQLIQQEISSQKHLNLNWNKIESSHTLARKWKLRSTMKNSWHKNLINRSQKTVPSYRGSRGPLSVKCISSTNVFCGFQELIFMDMFSLRFKDGIKCHEVINWQYVLFLQAIANLIQIIYTEVFMSWTCSLCRFGVKFLFPHFSDTFHAILDCPFVNCSCNCCLNSESCV